MRKQQKKQVFYVANMCEDGFCDVNGISVNHYDDGETRHGQYVIRKNDNIISRRVDNVMFEDLLSVINKDSHTLEEQLRNLITGTGTNKYIDVLENAEIVEDKPKKTSGTRKASKSKNSYNKTVGRKSHKKDDNQPKRKRGRPRKNPIREQTQGLFSFF
jgi:hypothetical protein